MVARVDATGGEGVAANEGLSVELGECMGFLAVAVGFDDGGIAGEFAKGVEEGEEVGMRGGLWRISWHGVMIYGCESIARLRKTYGNGPRRTRALQRPGESKGMPFGGWGARLVPRKHLSLHHNRVLRECCVES